MSSVELKIILGKDYYAFYTNRTLTVSLKESDNIQTQYLMFLVMYTHEMTHYKRIQLKKFKSSFPIPNNFKEYILDPEELIAFYNQIYIDSIIRRISFLECLSYYINNFIKIKTNDESVIIRFYKGMTTLLKYNNERLMNMNSDSYKSLEQFDKDMELWMGSIARSAMGVAPELREEYVREKQRQIQLMRLDIIKQLEDYENKQNQ